MTATASAHLFYGVQVVSPEQSNPDLPFTPPPSWSYPDPYAEWGCRMELASMTTYPDVAMNPEGPIPEAVTAYYKLVDAPWQRNIEIAEMGCHDGSRVWVVIDETWQYRSPGRRLRLDTDELSAMCAPLPRWNEELREAIEFLGLVPVGEPGWAMTVSYDTKE